MLSLGNFSVARLAQDLSGHDVPSVREVHVLFQHVHALPGERLSDVQHLDELGFLGPVSESLVVAIQAELAVRQGRVIGLFGADVAIRAGDLFLGHVDLVDEFDGLLDVAIGRTPRGKSENTRGREYGERPSAAKPAESSQLSAPQESATLLWFRFFFPTDQRLRNIGGARHLHRLGPLYAVTGTEVQRIGRAPRGIRSNELRGCDIFPRRVLSLAARLDSDSKNQPESCTSQLGCEMIGGTVGNPSVAFHEIVGSRQRVVRYGRF